MASKEISNFENRSPVIPPIVGSISIGAQAKKEQATLEQGFVDAGSEIDRKVQETQIVKNTSDLFKYTTYWGYALMTAVILFVGFIPNIFWIDTWVQISLILSVVGNNIARILKTLSGQTLNSFGMG